VDKIGDPIREHPGFPASGAGEDKERPLRLYDGLLLNGIEILKKGHHLIVSINSAIANEFDGSKARPIAELFNGYALGQISWLIHVRAFEVGHIIGEELERNREQNGHERGVRVGDGDEVIDLPGDLSVGR
jgi:hypothetical protein